MAVVWPASVAATGQGRMGPARVLGRVPPHSMLVCVAGRRCAALRIPHRRSHASLQPGGVEHNLGRCGAAGEADRNAHNPLELLREERSMPARAELMNQLGQPGAWSAWAETYALSKVEAYLVQQLGVDKQSVMQLAVSTVSNPPLCGYAVETVQTSITSLKAANVDVQDIWFLVSKRPSLLGLADTLQRWLDFLACYGLDDKDLSNFLLRAPQDLFDRCTIYEAGQVINFLKSLGIANEFLAQRVFAVWPAVLGRDVEGELRPVVSFLMALGLEVSDVKNMVGLWPELLLCSVPGQLEPFAQYLRGLGCSTAQLVLALQACPHLLGFKPDELFGHRLLTLQTLGISLDDVRAMVNASLAWLTATGGVQPQVDFLLHDMGCTKEQAKSLVVSCPDILAQRDCDLVRTWHFVQDELQGGLELIMLVPKLLAAGLMQTVGPRVSFLKAKKMEGVLQIPQPASEPLNEAPLALHALVTLSDPQWCKSMGFSENDFKEHCVAFQTDFTERITKDAAQEFQDELRKLGIYEGKE